MSDAGASLTGRPWHAIGMMSGIMLGVASATAAIAIADTQQAQIDRRFDLQRSTHVVVQAKSSPPEGFSSDQIRLLVNRESVMQAGEFSSWSDQESVTRSISSRTVSAAVIVADSGGLEATGTKVKVGAAPDLLDGDASTPVAWVGSRLADDIGVGPATDNNSMVDSQIQVAGHTLSVAGIVSNNAGFEYAENSVIVSRPLAATVLGGGGTNIRVVADVRPGSAEEIARYALSILDPTGELDLVDQTPPDGKQLLGNVGGDLRRVGIALSAFVGVVGMIAIANTLMMAVHHRLRELGLRSAMGWSRRRIGALVLTESTLAGVIAGLLGTALGLAAAVLWCAAQQWTLVVSPSLPIVLTASGTFASLVGGLLPAWRAASIPPITALRS